MLLSGNHSGTTWPNDPASYQPAGLWLDLLQISCEEEGVGVCCPDTHFAPTHTHGPGDEGVSSPLHHRQGVTFLLSPHGEGVNVKIVFVFLKAQYYSTGGHVFLFLTSSIIVVFISCFSRLRHWSRSSI